MDQELYVVAIHMGDHTVPALVSYVSGGFRRNRSADAEPITPIVSGTETTVEPAPLP